MTRELVYGRQPVREVVRAGKRQVLELLVTERALAAEPWLREISGLRLQIARERSLNDAAHTTEHQGVVAFCEPYRYADAHEVAAGESPLVVCLDQVTDPHNLGAVIRSAEGAGGSGIVITERNAARVTPAVCKASAGAVEHLRVAVVVNLARYLEEIKGAAAVGMGGRRQQPTRPSGAPTSRRRRARLRRGGEGPSARRSQSLRRCLQRPARGQRRVAERERRGRRRAVRGCAAATRR